MKTAALLKTIIALFFAASAFSCTNVTTAALLTDPLEARPAKVNPSPQYVKSFGPGGIVDLNITVPENIKTLYFSFTNTSSNKNINVPPIKFGLDGANAQGSRDARLLNSHMQQSRFAQSTQPSAEANAAAEVDSRLREFDAGTSLVSNARNSRSSQQKTRTQDLVGDRCNFFDNYELGSAATSRTFDATCRYAEPNLVTPVGVRHFSIWVADNMWANSSQGRQGTTTAITQAMVDALASKFIGNGNDAVFGWVTTILGAEWGTECSNYRGLIPFDSSVTLVLNDIASDAIIPSANGQILGYFSSANNLENTELQTMGYPQVSNQRIMFNIDAAFFAGYASAETWSIDSANAKIILGTLAHEMQHMVHFYQKAIVNKARASAHIWINEMCSLMVEDLLAEKLGIGGPRGVTQAGTGNIANTSGRIPAFNANPSRPLFIRSNFGLGDYSTAYAFGAWLLRNYGGSRLVKAIVNNQLTDATSITHAISLSYFPLTMNDLLSRWSIAILSSHSTTMPIGYTYNQGDMWFSSTSGAVTFKYGSIDFSHYSPALQINTFKSADSTVTGVITQFSSNTFYQITLAKTRTLRASLTLPSDMMLGTFESEK